MHSDQVALSDVWSMLTVVATNGGERATTLYGSMTPTFRQRMGRGQKTTSVLPGVHQPFLITPFGDKQELSRADTIGFRTCTDTTSWTGFHISNGGASNSRHWAWEKVKWTGWRRCFGMRTLPAEAHSKENDSSHYDWRG